ncbi:7943_t:CDS:2, partial [Gigaspora margarita]
EQKIRPKRQGRGIHVSEFLCEPLGRVHLTEERHVAHPEIPNRYITELLEIGANYEEIVFTLDHRDNKKKGKPKGIKEVMIERKIWNKRLRGKCVKCSKDKEEICCNMKKLARQPDFMEQK